MQENDTYITTYKRFSNDAIHTPTIINTPIEKRPELDRNSRKTPEVPNRDFHTVPNRIPNGRLNRRNAGGIARL